MQQFNQLLQKLADGKFPFVIIGGYAAVMHGSTMVTRDLDVCALLTEENVQKLRELLAEWNPTHRITAQQLSFLQFPQSGPVNNLYLRTDVGVIDVLSTVLGVGDFERLRSNAEDYELRGRIFQVIALEDLIAAKEAVGRPKDLLAVEELRAIADKRKQMGS